MATFKRVTEWYEQWWEDEQGSQYCNRESIINLDTVIKMCPLLASECNEKELPDGNYLVVFLIEDFDTVIISGTVDDVLSGRLGDR